MIVCGGGSFTAPAGTALYTHSLNSLPFLPTPSFTPCHRLSFTILLVPPTRFRHISNLPLARRPSSASGSTSPSSGGSRRAPTTTARTAPTRTTTVPGASAANFLRGRDLCCTFWYSLVLLVCQCMHLFYVSPTRRSPPIDISQTQKSYCLCILWCLMLDVFVPHAILHRILPADAGAGEDGEHSSGVFVDMKPRVCPLAHRRE
jgi:hypothetical protein